MLSGNFLPIRVPMKEKAREGYSKTVVTKNNLFALRKRKISWSEEKQDNNDLILSEDALIQDQVERPITPK